MSLVSVEKSIFLCIPSLSVSLFSIILHSNLYPPNWSNNTKTNLLSNQNDFIKIAPIIFIGVQMEEAMAPHSSSLAWKIPWMEEPGRLQSTGLLRVRHNWATSLSLFTFMHWRREWKHTSVFLPGESQGRGSLVYGVAQSQTRLKRLSSSSNTTYELTLAINYWIKCVLFRMIRARKDIKSTMIGKK